VVEDAREEEEEAEVEVANGGGRKTRGKEEEEEEEGARGKGSRARERAAEGARCAQEGWWQWAAGIRHCRRCCYNLATHHEQQYRQGLILPLEQESARVGQDVIRCSLLHTTHAIVHLNDDRAAALAILSS
jgi:hypothetical protein